MIDSIGHPISNRKIFLPIRIALYTRQVNRLRHVKTVRMADVRDRLELKERFSKEKNVHRPKRHNLSLSEYSRKKRHPYSAGRKGDRDIFITNKTNFKAQLKKCNKLLNNGSSDVIIHALGAAVYRACSLALQLKEIHYASVELDVKTSTVSIIDDFEPFDDNADYEMYNRNNSAVHIRIFRKFSIKGLKYQE